MVLHHIHEIWRRTAARSTVYEMQLRVLRLIFLVLRDVPVVHHLRQHAVSRFVRTIQMVLRSRIAIGRTDNSRQKRALPKVKFTNVFPEVRLSAFAEPANGEAPAIPEINIVGVELENLLFRKALVEFGRHQDFLQLAAPDTPRREEKRARHLHIDRTRALRLLAAPQVVKRRAEYAHEVQSAMLEKAFVLRRK